jgi:large conductance mechanosensitive channel
MLKEFREFATRGTMVDMAVGVVIGTAFGKIISSFVSDIIMPPIGFILGKVDFSKFVVTIHGSTADAANVTIKYGIFINAIINFIIVAFADFNFIKQINRLSRAQQAAKHDKKDCPFCCSSIPIKAIKCPDCTSSLN